MSQNPSVAVRRATAADHDMLASVLAEAFRDDPIFVHLLPLGIRRREARLRGFFELEVPRSVRLGGAWVSADGAGTAIWYPPDSWEPSRWQDLRQTPALLRPMLERCGSEGGASRADFNGPLAQGV